MGQGIAWKQLLKNHSFIAVTAFCVAAFVLIAVGVFVFCTPVVAMCTLAMIEAGIAVMLHRAELWVHGLLVIAEIVAGVLAGRIGVILLCAAVYAAATTALQVLGKDEV